MINLIKRVIQYTGGDRLDLPFEGRGFLIARCYAVGLTPNDDCFKDYAASNTADLAALSNLCLANLMPVEVTLEGLPAFNAYQGDGLLYQQQISGKFTITLPMIAVPVGETPANFTRWAVIEILVFQEKLDYAQMQNASRVGVGYPYPVLTQLNGATAGDAVVNLFTFNGLAVNFNLQTTARTGENNLGRIITATPLPAFRGDFTKYRGPIYNHGKNGVIGSEFSFFDGLYAGVIVIGQVGDYIQITPNLMDAKEFFDDGLPTPIPVSCTMTWPNFPDPGFRLQLVWRSGGGNIDGYELYSGPDNVGDPLSITENQWNFIQLVNKTTPTYLTPLRNGSDILHAWFRIRAYHGQNKSPWAYIDTGLSAGPIV